MNLSEIEKKDIWTRVERITKFKSDRTAIIELRKLKRKYGREKFSETLLCPTCGNSICPAFTKLVKRLNKYRDKNGIKLPSIGDTK